MIGAMRAMPLRAPAIGALLLLATSLVVAPAQEAKPEANANDCPVWTGNSLLANPYFLVGKNVCAYAIRIAYRYEEDVGTGCFGPLPCTALLIPSEIKRFTAGTIRFWACAAPAAPNFPDIKGDGSCD